MIELTKAEEIQRMLEWLVVHEDGVTVGFEGLGVSDMRV